jgi:sialate O-acetylesterase
MDNIRLSTVLFNGMVAPLMPLSIKGVIWYQGESNGNNTANASLYQKLFTTMITDWRKRWGQGDFPFLFVQLPNYRARRDAPGDSTWAILREAQRLTQAALPATGMAVTIDVGDAELLHPPNKAPVGHRLALLARHDVYGESIVAASPLYQSHIVSAGKVVITFDHVGEGLKLASPGELKGFAIAGAANKFVWAQARIENANSVSVWSDAIKEPAAIRYGWADNPEVNLCNSAGLPASPFQVSVK